MSSTTILKQCLSFEPTVGAIYIGAAKSIGAALFAAILGHLEKTFQNIKKKFGKSFFLDPYFKFEKKRDENLPFFSISCSFYTY
jgi:hypothetical protein